MRRFAMVVMAVGVAGGCGGDSNRSNLVTVHLRDKIDRPVMGAVVRGQAGDGTVVDTATTGPSGTVSLDVPIGGWITAHDAARDDFVTVLEVSPGDNLALRLHADGDELRRQVQVTLPALPPDTSRITLSARCGASNDDLLRLDPRCAGTSPLVATAYGGNGQPSGYLIMPAVDLSHSAVTMIGTWQVPVTTYPVALANIPAGALGLSIYRASLAGRAPVDWTFEPIDLSGGRTRVDTTFANAPVGDGVLYRVLTGDHRWLIRSIGDPGAGLDADLGELLPAIHDVRTTDHQVSWLGGGGGTGLAVTITTAEGSGDVFGAMRTWRLIAPAGATSVRFPADADFTWPDDQGDRVVATSVEEIRSTRFASYVQLRAGVDRDSLYEPIQIEPDVETQIRFGGFNLILPP